MISLTAHRPAALRRWLTVALVGLGGAAGAALGTLLPGRATHLAFGSGLLIGLSFLIGWSNAGSV